ncbi:MAG TPA: hypothetical protein VN035_14435 [Microbacterium sp.]|nr:hypothetical protein [Microbacterium sp.]
MVTDGMVPAVLRMRPRWMDALRTVITLQTVTVFAAAITAGMQLSDHQLHALHSVTSYTVFTVALLHVTVATLAWRPGRGSAKPLAYAGLLLVGILAQVLLGLTGIRFAHVPLGVLLFGACIAELHWSWTVRTEAPGILNPRPTPEPRHQ